MDMPNMPAWLETTLAYASVMIAALTALATFMDWAVPRLRAIGARAGSQEGGGVVGWVERAARGVGHFLDVVRKYVPRLAIVAPPETSRAGDLEPIGGVHADVPQHDREAPSADDDEEGDDDDDPDDPASGAPMRPSMFPSAPPPS